MEFGSIEREIHVDADPEIVFEVVSRPEHIREWWGGAEADISATPGAAGSIGWARGTADEHVERLLVVDADPPRLFSFRWVFEEGETSLLVTFELTASGAGTHVRMTETGFREKGWEAAVLEEAYADHVQGWDRFVPALGAYVDRLVAAR
ncbi:MAG: SRPBCC domain-containing protein [Brevundimonas sp.]